MLRSLELRNHPPWRAADGRPPKIKYMMEMMEPVLEANIFFYITSVAVIVLSVFLSVALYYLALTLRDARAIMRTIRSETEALAGDVDALRANIRESGTFTGIALYLFRTLRKWRRRKRKKTEDEDLEDLI